MDRQIDTKPRRKRPIARVVWAIILSLYAYGIFRMTTSDDGSHSLQTAGYGRPAKEAHGFAPAPEEWRGPVIQVYAARTRGPKKALAVHSWIATKRQDADHYMVSQVIGWRLDRMGTALFSEPGTPDNDWYGNRPDLLLDLRGPEAEALIDKVDSALMVYPWAREYTVWPGPNSNTFVAWMGLAVPELGLDLPATAIGKDWRPWSQVVGKSASGTGVQASLYGLLGASIGYEEGVEVNVLGLSVELDLFDLALELPGIGRVGQEPVDETWTELTSCSDN